MKKLLAIFLVLVMSLAVFTACNTDKTNDADDVDVDGTGTAAVGGDDAADKMEGSDLAYILDKGKMIVGVTVYAPMNYKDDDGKWTGFDTEFAEKVGEKLGVDVEFIAIDWSGKISEINSKAIDCVWNGMTLTDEVLKGMDCTEPYIENAQVVVMAADKVADYKTVDDLKKLTFACEDGSAGMGALEDNGIKYTSLETQADALLEVKSGAADACVIDLTMAEAMTGKGTDYEKLGVGITLTTEEYGIGFRKGSDMPAKVNSIMKELASEGFMTSIAEKYELADKLAEGLKDAAASAATEADVAA